MINEILFPLLLSLLVLFFGLFLLFGLLEYKDRNKKKYDFLSSFPFELGQGEVKKSFLSRFFFTAYGVTYVASSFYILYLNPTLSFLNSLGILLGIVSLFVFASMLALIYVPAYSFRLHLVSSVVFFAFSILADVLMGLTYLNLYQAQLASNIYQNNLAIISLVIMIINFVLAFFKGLILINPKLAHWTELDSSIGSDGVVTSSRPRPFVLAFSEWLVIFLNAISIIAYILGLFLMCCPN